MFIHINNKMIADLTKYLTELKEEQLRKLEEMNKNMENGGKSNNTNTDTNAEKSFTNNKTSFQLPISYLENKREINKNILNDLELIEAKDPLGDSLYYSILKPKSIFGKRFLNDWSKYYTTNTEFLKDSQNFYKSYENQYGGDLKSPVTMITGVDNK